MLHLGSSVSASSGRSPRPSGLSRDSSPNLSDSFDNFVLSASFDISRSDLEGIAVGITDCEVSALEGKVEEAIIALFQPYSSHIVSYLPFP